MTNLPTVLGVLALLGAGLLTMVLLGCAGWARRTGRRLLSQRLLLAEGVLAGAYVLALFVAGLFSRGTVLQAGTEKYICEVDCHLAYSVTEVRRVAALGSGADRAAAEGVFYLVTVRTRFDPATVSSRRPEGMLLRPNPRAIALVDSGGRRYQPSEAGTAALAASGLAGTPVTEPLAPGASYFTTLAFDLPADAGSPRLLIGEGLLVTRFIIGHENSPLHKKTVLALPPARQDADA